MEEHTDNIIFPTTCLTNINNLFELNDRLFAVTNLNPLNKICTKKSDNFIETYGIPYVNLLP